MAQTLPFGEHTKSSLFLTFCPQKEVSEFCWAKVNKTGEIEKITTVLGKAWFVILNFATFNCEVSKLAKAVDFVATDVLSELKQMKTDEINPLQQEAFENAITLVQSLQKLQQSSLYNHRVIKKTESSMQMQLFSAANSLNVSTSKLSESGFISTCDIIYHLFSTGSETAMEISENKNHKYRILFDKARESLSQNDDPSLTSSMSKVKSVVEMFEFPELAEARIGMKKYKIKSLSKGTSGIYLIPDRRNKPCLLFKPDDQIAGCINNPKHHQESNISKFTGIQPAQMGLREKLAYDLDRGYSGIPHTDHIVFSHFKHGIPSHNKISTGACQQFIDGCGDAIDHLKDIRDDKSEKTRAALHRMMIQDIRMLNADRHFKNMLYQSKNKKIIPIDHGLIMPSNAQRLDFAWMHLPQSAQHLQESEKDYIRAIDIEKDITYMRNLGLSEDSLERYRIANTLLKLAIEKNLTMRDIGKLMITGILQPSKIICKALPNLQNGISSYFEQHICQRIITDGEQTSVVLNSLIDEYINFSSFQGVGWSSEFLSSSISQHSFSGMLTMESESTGKSESIPQIIRIIRVAKGSGHHFEVIEANEIMTEEEKKRDNPKLTLTEMSRKLEERGSHTLALINGGYFHYTPPAHIYYWWNGERIPNNPVGAVKIKGIVRSQNPNLPLWGFFAVHTDNSISFKSSNSDLENPCIKNALGAAPILISDGELTDLQQKTVNVAQKSLPGARKCPDSNILRMQEVPAPGEFFRHIHDRHPRSALAKTADGSLLMIVVDGKQHGKASGMTGQELAKFLKRIGAVDALNLDGGGSTTLLARRGSRCSIINTPCDSGRERPIATAIAVTTTKKLYEETLYTSSAIDISDVDDADSYCSDSYSENSCVS